MISLEDRQRQIAVMPVVTVEESPLMGCRTAGRRWRQVERHRARQQGTSIGGDRSAVKSTHRLALIQGMKFEQFLVKLSRHKSADSPRQKLSAM